MSHPLFVLALTLLGFWPSSGSLLAPLNVVAPHPSGLGSDSVSDLVALNPTQVANVAEQISVRIDGQAPGSGVLWARQGQTYYVLTAAHVVATPDEYEVVTPDGQKYKVNYAQVKKLSGVDLAVVPFTSAHTYQLAKLGNSSQVQRGNPAFVAGWPAGGNAITNPTLLFQQGIISANSQIQQADGYGLIYTNNTLPGMSGGPVLNSQGEVIGIHGKGETERQQGTRVSEVVVKVGYNLGVPINTFLELAPRLGLSLPLTARPTPAPSTASPTPRMARVDDFIAEGSNKLHRGDYPGAIASFDRAIVTDPTAADAYRLRATARMSTTGWSILEGKSPRHRETVLASEADINQAIRLNPNLTEAYALRGYLRYLLNNKSAALEDLENALRLDANNGAAYIVRSGIRIEDGNNRGAIADATEAIQRDPNSPYVSFAYVNRGVARAYLKDYDNALPDLTRATQLAPQSALAYIARGQVRGLMGDTRGGLGDLQKGADLAVEQNNSALHRQAIQAIQALQMRQRLGF